VARTERRFGIRRHLDFDGTHSAGSVDAVYLAHATTLIGFLRRRHHGHGCQSRNLGIQIVRAVLVSTNAWVDLLVCSRGRCSGWHRLSGQGQDLVVYARRLPSGPDCGGDSWHSRCKHHSLLRGSLRLLRLAIDSLWRNECLGRVRVAQGRIGEAIPLLTANPTRNWAIWRTPMRGQDSRRKPRN
jgi:hypothetical protein